MKLYNQYLGQKISLGLLLIASMTALTGCKASRLIEFQGLGDFSRRVNGDSYLGKIYVFNIDAQCADRTQVASQIELGTDGIYRLTKDNCSELRPPVILSPIVVAEVDGGKNIIFEDRIYQLLQEEPVLPLAKLSCPASPHDPLKCVANTSYSSDSRVAFAPYEYSGGENPNPKQLECRFDSAESQQVPDDATCLAALKVLLSQFCQSKTPGFRSLELFTKAEDLEAYLRPKNDTQILANIPWLNAAAPPMGFFTVSDHVIPLGFRFGLCEK